MTSELLTPSAATASQPAAVDAPPSAAPLQAPVVAVPAELLDGGEIVILAIKPSLWSVVFSSFSWMVAAAAILAGASWVGLSPGWIGQSSLVQVVLTVVGLRIVLAMMQWAARAYVLTNRRILRIRGVFRADVFGCPLAKIINTGIHVQPHEALTRLGTIWFNTGEDLVRGTWYHVARPQAVHAEIRRAIERALDHHP